MLESELNDRETNDSAAGGRDAGELSPAVPAAVFQPPQVVFQPPTVRQGPAPAGQTAGRGPAGTPPPGPAPPRGGDHGPGSGRPRPRRPNPGPGPAAGPQN